MRYREGRNDTREVKRRCIVTSLPSSLPTPSSSEALSERTEGIDRVLGKHHMTAIPPLPIDYHKERTYIVPSFLHSQNLNLLRI